MERAFITACLVGLAFFTFTCGGYVMAHKASPPLRTISEKKIVSGEDHVVFAMRFSGQEDQYLPSTTQ